MKKDLSFILYSTDQEHILYCSDKCEPEFFTLLADVKDYLEDVYELSNEQIENIIIQRIIEN